MVNSLGRELPEFIGGYRVRPYQGLETAESTAVPVQSKRIVERCQAGQSKLLGSLKEALLACGLKDGMTPEEQAKRLPFRLIHAQMLRRSLIERMKKLPLCLDIHAPHSLMTDLHWIEDRVGKERAALSYLWKTYLDAGLIMAGGSDAPVESFNPWMGIYAAVTRQDMDGYPVGGYHPTRRYPCMMRCACTAKMWPTPTAARI